MMTQKKFENGVIPNRSLGGVAVGGVILAIGCRLVVISGLDFLFPKDEKMLSLGNRNLVSLSELGYNKH